MCTKKIFIFLLMGIFMINFASAFEFDDVRHYDPISRTTTINNCNLWLGFCIIKGDVKVMAMLESSLNEYVARGDDRLVGWFNYVTSEKDVKGTFGDIYLEDKKNGDVMSRGKQYKVRLSHKESVPDYKTVCKEIINGTNITKVCEEIEIGSHIETVWEWKPITNNDVNLYPNTLYQIGIFVDVKEGDVGEWIPTFSGKQIPEWATWTESLNTNLIQYWALEDNNTNTTVHAQVGTNGVYNGANTADRSITGRVNNGFMMNGSGDRVDVSSLNIDMSSDMTFNMWLKPDNADGGQQNFFTPNGAGTFQFILDDSGGGGQDQGLRILYDGVSFVSTADMQSGVWQMVTVTFSGSTSKVYINRLLNGTSGAVSPAGFTTAIEIGSYAVGANPFKGRYDEIGIWTRELSQAEITQLYNEGAGITYTNTFNQDPTIVLNSPSSANYTTIQNLQINFTAYDDINLASVKLYVDSVLNQTNATGINNSVYLFNLSLGDGDYLINGTATDNETLTANSTTIRIVINTTPYIDFVTPPTLVDYANITQEYIPIKVTTTTPYFKNITYNLYNINGTIFSQYFATATYDINFTDMPDAHYDYNVTICTTTDKCNSTETRHINHDATAPTITNAYNLTDLTTLTLPINSTWHYNATDDHINACYYNSTANATQTVITCNSTINTAWTTSGNKTLTYCANDTFGLESCNTDYVYIYYIQETQADNPDPIAESFDATFNLTINLTNIPTTTANLFLNNTFYSPTTTTAGTNGYYFEVTVTIPDGWGNTSGIIHDWLWNYTIDGVITSQNTSTENITIYELGIDNCSSYGELIFNFSVLDEEALTLANETETINVEADLVLTSKTNSSQYLSYSKTWTSNNNPQICVPSGVINNSQYWIDLTVGFSHTDHVWEFFYIDSGTLNSTKIYEDFNGQTNQSINLMNLLTADSTSFLFNYFDIDGLAVDGSIVHVMRKYIGSGVFREVERAKQDQNGDTIVHLVEEDVIYYFMITKDGVLLHTSSEYTALCQATPCTIQIEASGGVAQFPTDWDLIEGGGYIITSSATTREVTLTYENNASTTMNFTVYKYNSDGSYSIIDQDIDTGTSGVVTLDVPQVAGNVSFFATVIQDDNFINSEWVDFEEDATDVFGVTLALFMAGLLILTLGLFAVQEGVGTIVYVILGIIISGALGLIITDLSTGVNIVIYLVLAGAILLWKLTGGRR